MLLVKTGSEVLELTTAVLVMALPDELVGDVTIVIGKDAPDARLEIIQVTVPLVLTGGPAQILAGLTERKLTPAGSTSVTVTAEAVFGPLFVNCNKYVNELLVFTGLGDALLVIARSADGFTWTTAVAVLLIKTGSEVLELT